jgi:cytochrome c peroxidase
VSCNSCHNVMEAGDDDRAVSVGVDGKTGKRSAPTVWNSAFLTVMFWDGRAPSLEEQAKGPMVNSVEMGMPDHEMVVNRIAAVPGYRQEFKAVFGGQAPITIDNIAMAIAAYERTLVTPDSPFDRAMRGDKNAMSPAAHRGMQLAESVGCTSCHNGPVFAGPAGTPGEGFYMKFPVQAGTPYEDKYHLCDDPGRYEVTKVEDDRATWRVPMWRNVAVTAPYFHNGSVATLSEAVQVMGATQLGRELTAAEVQDLTAFLESLTGQFPAQTMPRLPETTGRSVVN